MSDEIHTFELTTDEIKSIVDQHAGLRDDVSVALVRKLVSKHPKYADHFKETSTSDTSAKINEDTQQR